MFIRTRRGHVSASPSKINPSLLRSRIGTSVFSIINCTSRPSFMSLAFLIGDPVADLAFQNIEGQRPVIEDGVVKFPKVEASAKLRFGLLSQFLDLQFAELIGERLSGPDDVAIDFDNNVVFRFR